MGWWIALAVLVCLAVLPLGIRVRYDGGGLRVYLLAGPVFIGLYPRKEKPKKEKVKKKNPRKKRKKAQDQPAPAQQKDPPEMTLEEKYPNLDKKPGRIPRTPPEKKEEQGGKRQMRRICHVQHFAPIGTLGLIQESEVHKQSSLVKLGRVYTTLI